MMIFNFALWGRLESLLYTRFLECSLLCSENIAQAIFFSASHYGYTENPSVACVN